MLFDSRETENAPEDISNAAAIDLVYPDNCTIPLCFLSNIAPDISHLTASPLVRLAQGFSLRSGKQDVVVPSNITSGTFQIIRESAIVKSNYHLNLQHGRFFSVR